ncbi:MAG: YkgJ family cysteine cluster protein [Burkholderiaceae bacterium]
MPASRWNPMNCRDGCGACCIAPSISSPIPGMPAGKPAGVRCVQLGQDRRCKLFGQHLRPAVCRSLQPTEAMCGASPEQAMRWLGRMEALTRPR